MSHRTCWKVCMLAAWILVPWTMTRAQSTSEDAIAEYRAMFGDENPAELWEIRGAELWHQKRGPKNADLGGCDLGRGAGVIEGAYAELPRWFADTGRVQDLETRLVTCMTTLQGFKEADVLKVRFGDGDKKSDLEALVAYVAKASKGKTI